jgi:hypothetical protein
MDAILGYLDDAPAWLAALGAVLGAAKAITVLTPTQVDDDALGYATKAVNILLRIVNTLALNVGRDENADDPKARP